MANKILLLLLSLPDFSLSSVSFVSSVVEVLAFQQSGAENALFAGRPVRVLGFQNKAGGDGEVEGGLVLEFDGDVLMVGGVGEYYVFDDFASELPEMGQVGLRQRKSGLVCCRVAGSLFVVLSFAFVFLGFG